MGPYRRTVVETFPRPSSAGLAAATALATLFLSSQSAVATSFTAQISDDTGHPLPSAVVTLTPSGGGSVAVAPAPGLMNTFIDQKDETFIPYVVAIMRGGTVTFRNSDTTRHHVYTFSPIHPFEFILKPGDISAPQRFDKPGIAAIGCNIHDQMIAYVFISDTPLTAVTDANGHAMIADVPAGTYQAQVWYPQMKSGVPLSPQTVVVGAGPAALADAIPAIPYVSDSMDGMDGMN